MDRDEHRNELGEPIARELARHALAAEGLQMTPSLHLAIAHQREQLGLPAAGFRVSGVSVTHEQGRLLADLPCVRGQARGA